MWSPFKWELLKREVEVSLCFSLAKQCLLDGGIIYAGKVTFYYIHKEPRQNWTEGTPFLPLDCQEGVIFLAVEFITPTLVQKYFVVHNLTCTFSYILLNIAKYDPVCKLCRTIANIRRVALSAYFPYSDECPCSKMGKKSCNCHVEVILQDVILRPKC